MRARGPRAGTDAARPAGVAGTHLTDPRGRSPDGLPGPQPAGDGAPGRVGPRRRLDAGLDRVRHHLAPRRRPPPLVGAQGAVACPGLLRRPGALPPEAGRCPAASVARGRLPLATAYAARVLR